jgi:hypothetical protein
MGMRYEDFWYNYDLRELSNAIEGYFEKEDRHNRVAWETTRILYAAIQNKPVHGYKIKPKQPDKLLTLPWDNNGELPTENEIDNLRKEMGWAHGQ